MAKKAKAINSDQYDRYVNLFKNECAESYAFQEILKNGIHKQYYPHLVDKVIKVIRLDLDHDQAYSDENLRTMFHNVGVLNSASTMIPIAVRDAVAFLREGKYRGYAEKMIQNGRYDELHDPHWTGD